MINFRHLDTPIGKLTIAGENDILSYLALPGLEQQMHKFFQRYFPGTELQESTTALRDAALQLNEYFSGTRPVFDLELSLTSPPFSKQVLQEVARIPFGATTSYGEIAKKLNNPAAVRAVGRANATNPIPIIIPCHRVIASDGNLQGYAGGLDMKTWLLRHEGYNI